MPDPILPDFFRCQVVFKGKTGLAEDVYVNNFVFRNDVDGQDLETFASVAADTLHHFYNDIPAGNASAIKGFLNGNIINTAYEVKVYDLGQAPPRLPVIVTKDFASGLGTAMLPPEVAACLSFYAGRSLPRQRGRVFLGPLTGSTLEQVNGRTQFTAAFRKLVGDSAAAMADEGIGGANWHVLSQVDAVAREVTGGWVDDAPDIQRRRGHTPTLRYLWGAPQVS